MIACMAATGVMLFPLTPTGSSIARIIHARTELRSCQAGEAGRVSLRGGCRRSFAWTELCFKPQSELQTRPIYIRRYQYDAAPAYANTSTKKAAFSVMYRVDYALEERMDIPAEGQPYRSRAGGSAPLTRHGTLQDVDHNSKVKQGMQKEFCKLSCLLPGLMAEDGVEIANEHRFRSSIETKSALSHPISAGSLLSFSNTLSLPS
jgi:hypothetical protein